MSRLDRWLSLARNERSATFATSATTGQKSQNSASSEVATTLLPVATSATPARQVAGCSGASATPNPAEIRHIQAEVADVAKVAGSPSREYEGDTFEERAAIVEFDAGVPQEWAEGFARLCQMPRPAAILPARWRELVDNAGVFIDRWAVQAASLGWNAADIFGCHREAPLARYDLQGLVFVIGSGEVVAITALSATIRTGGGATQTFRRTPPTPGEHVAAIWELCIEAGGESHG